MHSPFFGADVVRYTKYHGMRISDIFVFEYCRYGCTVVNDDSNVFEAIDGDEGFILIVSHVQQSSMNDLVREWYTTKLGVQLNNLHKLEGNYHQTRKLMGFLG